jgi:phage host-nuclease inhibitor protein Gam
MTGAEEDEMVRSITEVNAERTRVQIAAANKVRALSTQYDDLVGQVNDIVQQLRQAVIEARKVFELDELAVHTKRSLPELTGWAEAGEKKSAGRTKPGNRTAKGPRPDRRTPPDRAGRTSVPQSPPS